jgi:hypothetical protein
MSCLEKYGKLLGMGMPREHVEMKMKMDGIDPALLLSLHNVAASTGIVPRQPPPPLSTSVVSQRETAMDPALFSSKVEEQTGMDIRAVEEPCAQEVQRDGAHDPSFTVAKAAIPVPQSYKTCAEIPVIIAKSRHTAPSDIEKMSTVDLSSRYATIKTVQMTLTTRPAATFADRKRRWLQKLLVSLGRVGIYIYI